MKRSTIIIAAIIGLGIFLLKTASTPLNETAIGIVIAIVVVSVMSKLRSDN